MHINESQICKSFHNFLMLIMIGKFLKILIYISLYLNSSLEFGDKHTHVAVVLF